MSKQHPRRKRWRHKRTKQNYSSPGREWKGNWCITTGAVFSFTTMALSTAIFGSLASPPAASSSLAACCFLDRYSDASGGFFPSTAGAPTKHLQSPRTISRAFFFPDDNLLLGWCFFFSVCEVLLIQEPIYKGAGNISLCWRMGAWGGSRLHAPRPAAEERSRADSKLCTFTTKVGHQLIVG